MVSQSIPVSAHLAKGFSMFQLFPVGPHAPEVHKQTLTPVGSQSKLNIVIHMHALGLQWFWLQRGGLQAVLGRLSLKVLNCSFKRRSANITPSFCCCRATDAKSLREIVTPGWATWQSWWYSLKLPGGKWRMPDRGSDLASSL